MAFSSFLFLGHNTLVLHAACWCQSRNFALNPNEGLKIRPFKNAHTPQAVADRELHKLARYLVHITLVDDFKTLRHGVRRLSFT
jgi:hypothetical protein